MMIPESKQDKFKSGAAAHKEPEKDEKLMVKKKSSPEMDEYYDGDEFDEIDEDLPQDNDEMDNSDAGIRPSKIGESHGITVS